MASLLYTPCKEIIISLPPSHTSIMDFICMEEPITNYSLEDLIHELMWEPDALINLGSFCMDLLSSIETSSLHYTELFNQTLLRETYLLGQELHKTFNYLKLYENSVLPYQMDGRSKQHLLLRRVW